MGCVVPLIIHFVYRYVVYKVTITLPYVGPIFAGAFGYADDVALVAPTLYYMDKMIKNCAIFADKIGLLFNALKSNLLCYNVDNPDTVYVTTVRTSLHEKHLGNFIGNTIYDRNIKEHVCRLIGKKCDFM